MVGTHLLETLCFSFNALKDSPKDPFLSSGFRKTLPYQWQTTPKE